MPRLPRFSESRVAESSWLTMRPAGDLDSVSVNDRCAANFWQGAARSVIGGHWKSDQVPFGSVLGMTDVGAAVARWGTARLLRRRTGGAMTVEELVAAVVALAIVSAKRLGAGLANRATEGVEQSVADRLGRLYQWVAGRLPGEEGAALVDEAGRSPAAQALLRRRLVLALGEDPTGVEELRVLLSPHAPVLAHGDFLLPESSGIPRQLPLAVADFTGRGQELARLGRVAKVPSSARRAGHPRAGRHGALRGRPHRRRTDQPRASGDRGLRRP